MDEKRLIDAMTKDRRALHKIPELEFELYKTHEYIKNQLESLGYETYTIAKTGLIALLNADSDETIAFRSDMDALSVLEKTNVPFESTHPGAMHACGHDGHMALLLGFARHAKTYHSLRKNIAFLFQPAEEEPGGAKVIIEEGVLKRFNIKTIFGFHLYPELEEGKIGLIDGPALARSGIFDISIQGKSAHGAQPHEGSDSITPAIELIGKYQNIVNKMVDPFHPTVMCIGTIKGGEARNIVAQNTVFEGTLRTFNESDYATIKKKMRHMGKDIENSYDVSVDVNITDFYPAVVNDSNLFNTVDKALDEKMKSYIRPMMFAEDFSYYQQEIPGFFMMLGVRNETKRYVHPLHSCYFNFDESVLINGIKAYDLILRNMNIV